MQVEKYLEKYQPIIYQTFKNSLENNKLSHAYLIIGGVGTPLKEVATFLAKSIVCDDPTPYACNNCITCLRIDDNNYPDFITIDGSKSFIKKEYLDNVATQFNMSAFEKKGIMIYVVHLIENMLEETINSILKFLEEPKPNVYAFLTTNNENAILPTIISRCQTLHLKPIDRKEIIDSSISLGIEKESAELLSYLYNDAELIFNAKNDEDFFTKFSSIKNAIIEAFKSINEKDYKKARFIFQFEINPLVNGKEDMRLFLDLLIQFFEDTLNIKNNKVISLETYATIIHELAENINNVDLIIVELLKQRNMINMNLNNSLQIDHIINVIIKEIN